MFILCIYIISLFIILVYSFILLILIDKEIYLLQFWHLQKNLYIYIHINLEYRK